MTAYLKDHSLYYRGENITYSLQREVASASGSIAEYALLSHLLSNSIVFTKKGSRPIYIKDQVPASCCLFLFPPQIQAILSILFSTWEGWSAESLYSKYPSYEQELRLLSPYQILKLNTDVLRLPISSTVTSILSNQLDYSSIQILDALFSFDLDILKPTYTINNTIQSEFLVEQVVQSILDHYNYNNTFTEDFLDIVRNGDRMKSLYYICASLGYTTKTIKGLAGLLELWELDNH